MKKVGKKSVVKRSSQTKTSSPTKKAVRTKKTPTKKKASRVKRVSRTKKPEEMPLDDWQVALRRQFGSEQDFKIKNTGDEPTFSDFQVTNPETERTYRVAIRGEGLGESYCSCPDFAVNTLGTCKHIEFTLAKLRRKRGGAKKLADGFQPDYSEVYLRYGAERDIIFRAGRTCPDPIVQLAKRYFDRSHCLKQIAYTRVHLFLKKASMEGHELRCYDDALRFIAEVRDKVRLEKLVSKAFPKGVRDPAMKKLLKTRLYPYQREGTLFAAKAGRCLIADDMGLGKTIQAIAAVEILAQTVGVERVLVVSPTSLKHQWESEIEKFTDRESMVVEGAIPKRNAIYRAESFYKLTNYDVVGRDLQAILDWRPDVIILDEAQRIKNWKTQTAQAVKKLESQFAFVLTGTPLENRIDELHSIVEFVDRFRLGPMFQFLDRHQHVDESGRVVGYRNLKQISKTLAPILVRRTKANVLKQLPERIEKRFFVPMTPLQLDYHDENRQAVAQLVRKWRRYHYLSETDQLRMRIALQNMRMSCNSTYLLDKETDHGVKSDELICVLEELFERPDAKAVVFSQWTRMQELVERRLTDRPWGYVRFHGRVPGPKRKQLISQFKEDPNCRLFLSTDAGGVGLNLQNASVVVNLDQPWNPAILEQRIGRVHRLGQEHPVNVIHFISQGTIEESMLGLLSFKAAMSIGVLDNGQDEVFLGKNRMKQFMESIEKATDTIPQSPVDSMPPPIPEPKSSPVGEPLAVPSTNTSEETKQRAEGSAPSPEEVWGDVIATGVSLLEKLGQALSNVDASANGAQQATPDLTHPSNPLAGLVAQDEQTGRPYLKIPMPEQDAITKVMDLLQSFSRQ